MPKAPLPADQFGLLHRYLFTDALQLYGMQRIERQRYMKIIRLKSVAGQIQL